MVGPCRSDTTPTGPRQAWRRDKPFVISIDPLLVNQRAQIITLAAHYAVPGIYAWREYAAAGGLMSYGSDLAASYRETGVYVGRILKGESAICA